MLKTVVSYKTCKKQVSGQLVSAVIWEKESIEEDKTWDVSHFSRGNGQNLTEFKNSRSRNTRYKKALAILSVLVYKRELRG